jgi:hypothetical protein
MKHALIAASNVLRTHAEIVSLPPFAAVVILFKSSALKRTTTKPLGGLQVWLLWRTLGTIKRQADQMESQLSEMRRAADIENKHLILQYRPRIILRNAVASEFNLEATEIEGFISFQVVNIGGSPAHIFGDELQMLSIDATSVKGITSKEGNRFHLPPITLQAGERTRYEVTLKTGAAINDLGWFNYFRDELSARRLCLFGQRSRIQCRWLSLREWFGRVSTKTQTATVKLSSVRVTAW